MAASYTTYGAWTSGSNRSMRLRHDITVATPSIGATTVSVTVATSVEARYGFWDSSATYTRSGAMGSRSESISVSVSTNGSTVIDRVTASLPIYTSGAYMVAVASTLSGVDYVGATASHRTEFPLPGQVSGTPGRPAPTAMYVSDTQAQISWGATDMADRYYVEQWSEAHQRWTRLGIVYGTSVTDYGLSPNNRYKWRVCAGNSAGYESAWAETSGIRTTPHPPALSVTRSGATVTVTVTPNTSGYAQVWYLERSINGGAWQYWTQNNGASGQAGTTAAAGDNLRFRGRSGVTEGGTRWSTWTTTELVLAPTAPAAPTLLEPTGTVSDNRPVVLRWRHNALDLTAQTVAEIRWRVVGTETWRNGVSLTKESIDFTLPIGLWEWQVRTKGEHADYSPWSPVAGFRVAAPPIVDVTYPTDGAEISAAWLAPRLAWSDQSDAAMTAWSMQLHNVTAGQQVWSGSGTGSYTTQTLPHRMTNHTEYRLEVTATSGTGLSVTVSRSFTTRFQPPAVPGLVAVFVEADGAVVATATAGPATGGTPATTGLRIETSHDLGHTWQLLASGADASLDAVDTLPPLGGETWYRTIAESALPSEAVSDVVRVGTGTSRVWLTSPDLLRRAWCTDNVKLDTAYSIDRVVEHYEGATYPTVHTGTARTVTVQLSGDIFPDDGSPAPDWVALLDGTVWLRSPRGHRLLGAITGDIKTSDIAGTEIVALDLTVTQVEEDH